MADRHCPVSYLSAGGKAGDKIRVIAECEKSKCPGSTPIRTETTDTMATVGKTLAFTHVKFFNGKGDMFARGSHTK
jgi:acyl-coenzyme A thioesterase 13